MIILQKLLDEPRKRLAALGITDDLHHLPPVATIAQPPVVGTREAAGGFDHDVAAGCGGCEDRDVPYPAVPEFFGQEGQAVFAVVDAAVGRHGEVFWDCGGRLVGFAVGV